MSIKLKKNWLILISLIFVLSFFSVKGVSATTGIVNQTYPPCTTGDYYTSTIQDAVDAVPVLGSGTIIVCPGTYEEAVDIFSRYIDIRSYSGNPSDTIVKFNTSGNLAVFEVETDKLDYYINISGFTITGATGNQESGIWLLDTNYANISNNNISGNYFGIYVKQSNNSIIENNNVTSNNYWGIFVYNSSSVSTIRYNNISNNKRGIYLDDDEGPCIDNTISYNNILNNIQVDFMNRQSNSATADYNWWGTTSCSAIDSNIYDDDENPSYGKVDFSPPLNDSYPYGSPVVENCTDSIDNDCDGLVDENDPDCTATCGLTANNISFGNVETGQISNEKTVTLTNTGNTETTSLTISGTDWTNATYGYTMPVGQTHWNITTSGMDYSDMMILTDYEVDLGTQVSPGSLPVYFKLKIPEGQTAGDYTQTITFTGSC